MEHRDWPKNGDIYYWVRSDIGDICKSAWIDNARKHEFRWSIGNVFRTENDARNALAEVQHNIERKRRALK